MTNFWIPIADADDRGRGLFLRHYSAHHYQDRRRRTKFIGPGQYIALLTLGCDALFVWRKFIDKSGQQGINCSIFRNEGRIQSSRLIIEADNLAWQRWPGERLYTYVNPGKIRSTNPGYCFKMAGWRICGITKKRKLLILEMLPEWTHFPTDSPLDNTHLESLSTQSLGYSIKFKAI